MCREGIKRVGISRAVPTRSREKNSGLVTQTLLVTVLAHALAALVLINLCLTSLLEGSHNA